MFIKLAITKNLDRCFVNQSASFIFGCLVISTPRKFLPPENKISEPHSKKSQPQKYVNNYPPPPPSLFIFFLSTSFPLLFKKNEKFFGGGGLNPPLNTPLNTLHVLLTSDLKHHFGDMQQS